VLVVGRGALGRARKVPTAVFLYGMRVASAIADMLPENAGVVGPVRQRFMWAWHEQSAASMPANHAQQAPRGRSTKRPEVDGGLIAWTKYRKR